MALEDDPVEAMKCAGDEMGKLDQNSGFSPPQATGLQPEWIGNFLGVLTRL
jgi:hypothetical protein